MARRNIKLTDDSYDVLILAVAEKVCEEHETPIAADYERAVAQRICALKKNPDYITARQVHTAVRNHLMVMAENGDLISDGKHYWTGTAYSIYSGERAFTNDIKPAKKEPLFVTPNTVAIVLEPDTDKAKAKKAVLSVLGSQTVFSTFVCEDTLFILLEPYIDGDIPRKIVDLANKAYNYHHDE